MIRLPATGISLSNSDMSFHLQQIDIYHGLLRQGFKKNEILRYFNEYQAAQNPLPRPCSRSSSNSLGSPSLSTVELAARSPYFKDLPLGAEGSISPADAGGGLEDVSPAASAQCHSLAQPHRHAPRQSSLLRFAQALSSSSSPVQTEVVSDTHTENQAEALEPQLVSTISRLNLGLQDAKSPRSMPRQWAEAEPFVPASQRQSAARPSVAGDARYPALSRATSPDEPVPRASTSQLYQTTSTTNMPSSPPSMVIADQSEESASLPMPSPPALPQLPANSASIHLQHRGVLTEPRANRRLHLESASFPVYNDGLPVDSQPQTPADLSRHLVITEEDAAYTAPPGALYTASPTRRSRLAVAQADLDEGDQSPVAMAMGSRERRTRELMRGLRAERVRFQRQLQHDRDIIARGLDGGVETSDGDPIDPTTLPEFWRDDFEGDRVGDENWEERGFAGWPRAE